MRTKRSVCVGSWWAGRWESVDYDYELLSTCVCVLGCEQGWELTACSV